MSDTEIDQIRLEVNVSTADEPEEKMNEGSASRNNEASLAVDQPVFSNEREATSDNPCNSENKNQESDMQELFITKIKLKLNMRARTS